MFVFILSVLSVFIAAFLILVALQLLRMERVIAECTDIADVKVRKLYGKK